MLPRHENMDDCQHCDFQHGVHDQHCSCLPYYCNCHCDYCRHLPCAQRGEGRAAHWMLSYELLHQGHSLGDDDVHCLHYDANHRYVLSHSQPKVVHESAYYEHHGMRGHVYLRLDGVQQLCVALRYED